MPQDYPLARHGVFWTIQGEGALTGEPMAFVRLAGCSVGCQECDTDYRVFRRVCLEDLVREVQSVTPSSFVKPWVWLTGGEPTDHDLAPLVDVLQTVGFNVALATSGVRPVRFMVQWLSVSPHSAEVAQKNGHELKIIPGLHGLPWEAIEDIGRWSFPYRYIQPLWLPAGIDEDGSVMAGHRQRCIEFVRANPGWRLGNQAHKAWGVA